MATKKKATKKRLTPTQIDKIKSDLKKELLQLLPKKDQAKMKKQMKNIEAKAKKAKAPIKNKIALLLDSSGSMNTIRNAARFAFNDIQSAIKSASQESGQDTTLSFYTFGEAREPVNRKFFDFELDLVRPLREEDYKTEGGTPLFDCVGKAIEDFLELSARDKTLSLVITVITDGEEIDSRKYNAEKLKKLMEQVQKTDKWTITFMLPQGSKAGFVRRFGFPEGNVNEWQTTSVGAQAAGASIARGYGSFFKSRAAGKSSTKTFFTDLSKLSTSTVKRNLTNLASQFTKMNVGDRSDIKTFVQNAGLTFVKGNGYYQLVKSETVQDYKQFLLVDKKTNAIYGGSEARELLGLPDTGSIKLRPGDHATWGMFVQSTSVNRQLDANTEFYYKIR